MKTKLPKRIKTIQQAKEYLTELYLNDESYHPEDSANSIEWDTCKPTEIEAQRLDCLMTDIYNLCGNNDNHKNPVFDPCRWLLSLDVIDNSVPLIEPLQRHTVTILWSDTYNVRYSIDNDIITLPIIEFCNYVYYGGYVSLSAFEEWQELHQQN